VNQFFQNAFLSSAPIKPAGSWSAKPCIITHQKMPSSSPLSSTSGGLGNNTNNNGSSPVLSSTVPHMSINSRRSTNATAKNTSGSLSANSKEYEQVNQVFDGLSMSIHQLYAQLKQTQSTIRKISESSSSLPTLADHTVSPSSSALFALASPSKQHVEGNKKDVALSPRVEQLRLSEEIEQLRKEKEDQLEEIKELKNQANLNQNIQLELEFKNQENSSLKLQIDGLQNEIETLKERILSNTLIVEPANHVHLHIASGDLSQLKEELSTQQEINRLQQNKIQNYETAIQLVLSRSHNKISEIQKENSHLYELLTRENNTLQVLNSKLLTQNIVLKSKLLEMIQVMRDASRERDLELIHNDSVVQSYSKERETLLDLLELAENFGSVNPTASSARENL